MSGDTQAVRPELDTCRVDAVDVHAFEVPTDGPAGKEQDGTLEWDSTTMVLVRVHAAGETGVGYTYGDVSVASFVDSKLTSAIEGQYVTSPAALWHLLLEGGGRRDAPGWG